MRNLLVVVLVALVSVFSGVVKAADDVEIFMAYPWQDQQQIEADSVFVFGYTTPGAFVEVNGITAITEPDHGIYLAVVPVDVGETAITVKAELDGKTSEFTRSVVFPGLWETTPGDIPAIEEARIQPAVDQVLMPGDELRVFLKGTPGADVTFSIEGLSENLPMTELTEYPAFFWGEARFGDGSNTTEILDIAGIYVGSYIIQPHDRVTDAKVTFEFKSEDEILTAEAKGKVSVMNPEVPQVARVIVDSGWLRSSTGTTFNGRNWTWMGTGYSVAPFAYQPKGVQFQVTGKEGNYYRVKLAQNFEVYIHQNHVELLPLGTPIPRAEVAGIRTLDYPDKTQIRFYSNQAVPVIIDESTKPNKLIIAMYSARWHHDSIFQDFESDLITSLYGRQVATDTAVFEVGLSGTAQFGYNVYYDRNELVVEVRKVPEIDPDNPLRGRTIVVDPGHGGSSDSGGTGPNGIHERFVVLDMALRLQKLLTDAGANVIMTRTEDVAVSLADRSGLALSNNADLFVSVHANAFPDGIDSTKYHGHSVIYNFAFNEVPARYMQQALLDEVGFKNYGVQLRGNLGVLRRTEFPAILVEVGFMMHPEEINMMLDPEGQQTIAQGLFKGIENYFRSLKE